MQYMEDIINLERPGYSNNHKETLPDKKVIDLSFQEILRIIGLARLTATGHVKGVDWSECSLHPNKT